VAAVQEVPAVHLLQLLELPILAAAVVVLITDLAMLAVTAVQV
jgi:hypothetical protein